MLILFIQGRSCCFYSNCRDDRNLPWLPRWLMWILSRALAKHFCLLKNCGSTPPQMPEHHCTFIIPLPLSFFAVSSCITTYKKTPPPVPPRTSTCSTASKPYISITAQSSTESAQVSHKSPLYPATASEFQPFIFMGFKPLDRFGNYCWKCSAA